MVWETLEIKILDFNPNVYKESKHLYLFVNLFIRSLAMELINDSFPIPMFTRKVNIYI